MIKKLNFLVELPWIAIVLDYSGERSRWPHCREVEIEPMARTKKIRGRGFVAIAEQVRSLSDSSAETGRLRPSGAACAKRGGIWALAASGGTGTDPEWSVMVRESSVKVRILAATA